MSMMKLGGLLVSAAVVLSQTSAFAETYVMDLESEAPASRFRMMAVNSSLQVRLELSPEEYQEMKNKGHVIEPVQQYKVLGHVSEDQDDEVTPGQDGGALAGSWAAKMMETERAHKLDDSKGRGQKVCVIDTGVDKTHSYLSGKIASVLSRVPDKTTNDKQGHGTHVASLIVGGTALGSAAPAARIVSVKALADNGVGDTDWIAGAVDDCREAGVQVINMSLGAANHSSVMEKAIRRAIDSGITVVAATGNDGGKLNYPAAYSGVMAVGATTSGDSVASFSCRGPNTQYVAPGANILGARAGGGTIYMTGTSMASPFVAGIVAMKNSRASKGIKTKDLNVSSNLQGKGRVNAFDTANNK